MPLRVPELAPSLGRVLVPRRVAEPWVPIDDIREALATRVLELGGEARAAAEREDRERVLETVSRRAWLAAWEQAVRRAADRVTHALDGRLEAAWLALEAVVAEEERRWSPELESLERWRPSLWPLLILWTPVAAALVWLGLALGGYVPAPAWLATRLGF